MEVAKTFTKIGSFQESLLLLGFLLKCLGSVLCVLLAVLALVLLDWLAVLCFLELRVDEVLCMLLAVHALVLLDWPAVLPFLELCTDVVLCMILAVRALVLLDWLAVLRFFELHMDAVLCVLLAVGALVSLDWLALLRFLQLCCTSTILFFAWAGRRSFAAGCCLTLSRLEVPPFAGTMLHDWGGSLGGHSTSLCCGGGGMPLLVDSECLGQMNP
jgi:hypothetical protein